jgi:hypothetical protein
LLSAISKINLTAAEFPLAERPPSLRPFRFSLGGMQSLCGGVSEQAFSSQLFFSASCALFFSSRFFCGSLFFSRPLFFFSSFCALP